MLFIEEALKGTEKVRRHCTESNLTTASSVGMLISYPESTVYDRMANALWAPTFAQITGMTGTYRKDSDVYRILRKHAATTEYWRHFDTPYYKIGRDFFSELHRRVPFPGVEVVRNLKETCVFIEHPPFKTKAMHSSDKVIDVDILGNLVTIMKSEKGDNYIGAASYTLRNGLPVILDSFDGRIEALLNIGKEGKEEAFPGSNEHLREYYRVLANIIVYIQTGDPDLREFRPGQDKTCKKQMKKLGIHSTVPITLVSWGWKKPREEHNVRGHFRWQACGKEWSETRLTWVTPHARNGKKDAEK